MYYNRFRYYSPKNGSYINQDPIGLQGGINLYDYPRDPVHFVDPYGLVGENVFIHYTDKVGFESIMKSGVINANAKGKVYITDLLMSPEDVMRDVLINNPKHVGRGGYSIIFKLDQVDTVNIKQSSALEYIHLGNLKLNNALYSGSNPYSIVSTLGYEERRNLTLNQIKSRGKNCG